MRENSGKMRTTITPNRSTFYAVLLNVLGLNTKIQEDVT